MSPFVSIIIPTYNEEADIRETLDSLAALDYAECEALIVDASKDSTPDIVTGYPSSRVKLIRQSHGRGRAAARNEGILAARGEIVIILNADVRLPPNFIRAILTHYAQGADYVLVESRVTNTQHATARYVQALHEYYYPPRRDVEEKMNWTEGFSCRREAAIAVGLIPEGGEVTLVAGEDGWFGEKLAAAGYAKVFDHGIVVTHVMPPDLAGFWHQRVGRGQGTAQIWHQRDRWSLAKMWRTVLVLTVINGLSVLVPLVPFRRALSLTAFSPQGHSDWLVFAVLNGVELTANLCGLWLGLIEAQCAHIKRRAE